MEERGLPLAPHLLQHTLRTLCVDSNWVYAVFWRILPRSYPPPKILAWEDGFCDFGACARAAMDSKARESDDGSRKSAHRNEDLGCGLQPDLFFKMSHEVYNFGEGLMGKVAADGSHKWIFGDPLDHEISFLSPWHNSIDPHPRTWEAQFKSGIQTIAVIAVREGLVQLGATKKVTEDLNFVVVLQRKFIYLQTIPGVFLPHPTSPSSGSETTCISSRQFSQQQMMMMMMMPPPPPPPVMPSMSSLEALLSKLPSVTNTTTALSPPNGFLTRSLSCPRQPFPEPSVFLHNPQQILGPPAMDEFPCTQDHESGGTEMDSYFTQVID
ncbi:protein RICE SALT SENSITIVE 3 isoform X2 [Cryptomeria japonica]|uniref:protein RICE SALT SENSITIVE 3 isoform X2 n=1 Tax=Cryptomeria japonica TaxID=3369 RepID=UPI0027DAAC9B|nr:protein RICE SALT SENSITIVE 3 isoform X2 [Cryptomeria japonica]